MKRKRKNKAPKERNWLAVLAHQRGGAGSHRSRARDLRRGSRRHPKHKGRDPE